MFELCLITPERPAQEILRGALRAIEGAVPGRVALQLRAKHLPLEEMRALALRLREPTRAAGVILVINREVALARESSADAVQLPERSLSVADARAQLGADVRVGVSCHDAEGLKRAADGGADFAMLAPVHDVPGKAPALGAARFTQLARAVPLPVHALGGVTLANLGELIAGGAAGVALIREVFDANDPKLAVRACLHAIDAAGGH